MSKYINGTISDKRIAIVAKPVVKGAVYTLEFDSNKQANLLFKDYPDRMILTYLSSLEKRKDENSDKVYLDIKFMNTKQMKEDFIPKEQAKPCIKFILKPEDKEFATNILNQLNEQALKLEKENTSLHKIESVLGK